MTTNFAPYPNNQPQQAVSGKLKIYISYAPGVGKTQAMLKTAHQHVAEGQDLAIACIERHGLPEIETLLTGLELIPPKQIEQRGVAFTEMNLDAVLARRPQLVLVDELAHTNASGARHAKRYQDVLELLNAGIDVYTTLNIQNLASLNDIVSRITGHVVDETIPDHVFDMADVVEFIDLPPDELLQRVQTGKIYNAKQPDSQFFCLGHLMALRQLALRRVADRIETQLQSYMQTHNIAGPWPSAERLLVCVSPSPLSERLIQTAQRLAAGLKAEWFAVYVKTPGSVRLSGADHNRVAHNLQLAESLGAKTLTLTGESVSQAIAAFAQARNITKIVAGKPLRTRWAELWHGSIIDQMIRHSDNLDIYVISGSPQESSPAIQNPQGKRPYPWPHYVQSVGLVMLVTLLGYPLRPFVEPTNLVMLYLLAVVIAALRLGRYPAIVASVLSVVAFNFVFVPPYYTYVVTDAQFLLTFVALLIVGTLISTLAANAREQARAAQQRETQTVALYEFSRDLTAATDVKEIAKTLVDHLAQTVEARATVLLPQKNRLNPYATNSEFLINPHELATADWAFEHRQPAGRETDTFTESVGTYLPLKTARNIVGVLGLQPAKTTDLIASNQQWLVESFANQTAQAIERLQLAEEARQAQLLRETEKLQTALLNSISHDLRTPLASITGALSSLHNDAAFLNADDRGILINTAWEQADRLNRLVGNLLEMTRLESGVMRVKKELCDVQDLIGVALTQLTNRLGDRAINIDVPNNLPLAPMDFVLMVQVLVNLLDNALKYSPLDQPVNISARVIATELEMTVIDQGVGIPKEALKRVFEKFYRVQRADGISGTGLGLSISHGIVEAHGGRIWAMNKNEGGTIITIALPLELDSAEVN